ncbi:MAG: helix-turn-helix domain-containing protein [Steroidobacteraceae bacterium]
MNLYELREQRVRQLIRSHFGGKQSSFAKAVEIDPTTVSRWLTKARGRKQIGDKSAVKIEEKLGLPAGSLLSPDRAMSYSQKANIVQMPVFAVRDGASYGWPFDFPRERFEHLSDRQKGQIEGVVRRMLDEFEAEAKRSGTKTPS